MIDHLPPGARIHRFPCWCGQSEAQLRFRTARFGLVQCPGCGCYRIDPPPLGDEAEAPSFYTDYYAQAGLAPRAPESLDHRDSRFWSVVEQIPALSQVGARAVDIGCGEGRLCAELQRAGWGSVIGVDVSCSRIARARQRYPDLCFYDRPLHETPTAPRSLDLVVMDNVIEHLLDPLLMLQQLHGYLCATGRLVVITPNMQSGHFRLLGRRWTPELAPHAHVFLFTPAALRALLGKAGYAVEATGSFHLSYYPVSAWLRRLASGDLKGATWRAVQELGGAYGRTIGAGPMLFAVARPATEDRRK